MLKFNNHVLMEEAGENPTGGDPAGDPPSSLPSDNPAGGAPTFEIKPEDLTDGKFQGKWNNPTEMSDYIKTMEDKYANLTREVKDNTKQTDEQIAATADQLKADQLKSDTIHDLIPKFMENGMVVDDEMKQTLVDAGLTEAEIKLGAYEIKESLDKNASYVGGKENYDIIMNHHAENMTPEQKVQFNHSIQNPNNSEALMVGLQVMYEKSLSENPEQPVDRIRGNAPATQQSVQPYASKAELLADKAVADSRTASQGDKARYRQKLALTPDNVWKS